MGYVLIVLGAALTGLVLFQMGITAFRSLSLAREGRLSRRLQLEELRARIDLIKEAHREQEALQTGQWNGFRKFLVKQIRRENSLVSSIYLAPHDGKKLPPFKPGQFLTFNLKIPGQDKPVVRCYSLSSAPQEGHYRVTVKKIPPNPKVAGSLPGLSSTYFNEVLREGDILDVKAPGGSFFLDLHKERRPVVLIGGGIGVTPVYSMLQALAERGDDREVWFFYGVRHQNDMALIEEIREMMAKLPNGKLRVCASEPTEHCKLGVHYDVKGHVSVDLFKQLLPSNNYEYLLCGPPPMMEAVVNNLKAWGVPDSSIHFEAFGFATVKKATPAPAPAAGPSHSVKFAKSGKSVAWDGTSTSVLELAEKNSVAISSGCRAGNCGTCVVAVKSGSVGYLHEPGMKPDAGTCLACVAVPKGDIELDA